MGEDVRLIGFSNILGGDFLFFRMILVLVQINPFSPQLREMDGKKAPPASATQADMAACPNAELVGMFKEISDYYFQTPGMDQSEGEEKGIPIMEGI